MSKINTKNGLCKVLYISLFSYAGYVSSDDELFTPTARASISYDDNVFLLSDDELVNNPIDNQTDPKDTITELGVGFRSDTSPQSQRFLIEGDVYKRDYSNFDQLNFTGGNLRARWDWYLSKKWDGEINYLYTKAQSNLSDQRLPNGDVFDSNKLSIKAIRHFSNNQQLYLATILNEKEYEQRTSLDNEQENFTLGYKYTTSMNDTVALEVTSSSGENMNEVNRLITNDFTLNPDINNYEQDAVNLITRWNIGANDKLTTSIGYVSREHNQTLTEFEFDGIVYDLRYDWKVGYRTEINWRLGKQLSNTENTQILFAEADTAQVNAKWDASEKIQLSVNVRYRDLKFTQIEEDRDDQIFSFGFNSRYRFNSRVNIDLSLSTQSRDSSEPSNEFNSTIAMISINFNAK